jgi:hypothetical protein
MGGSAACFEQTAGTADRVAMCAWSDNDSFGILASPTLSAANLANLMVQDRPLIEGLRPLDRDRRRRGTNQKTRI